MKARWIIASAAALGLAAASVPVVTGIRRDAAPTPSAAALCDAKKKPASLKHTLKDMDGRDVDLTKYKGQVILLNFWATWCGPCKYEIPAFVELQTKYRSRGFVVLGVSVDDEVETLKPFAAKYKMNYPVLMGLNREDFVEQAWGPMWGIPTTFIIGRDGNVCRKHTGLATKEQIEREVLALL